MNERFLLFSEFPPFQKQILSHKLINVAVSMALNDHEFYVRASALKCIAAATKVSILWDQVISEYPNVQVSFANKIAIKNTSMQIGWYTLMKICLIVLF